MQSRSACGCEGCEGDKGPCSTIGYGLADYLKLRALAGVGGNGEALPVLAVCGWGKCDRASYERNKLHHQLRL
jgi:hypothetical protein